jgi:hypothetical protein
MLIDIPTYHKPVFISKERTSSHNFASDFVATLVMWRNVSNIILLYV